MGPKRTFIGLFILMVIALGNCQDRSTTTKAPSPGKPTTATTTTTTRPSSLTTTTPAGPTDEDNSKTTAAANAAIITTTSDDDKVSTTLAASESFNTETTGTSDDLGVPAEKICQKGMVVKLACTR